VVCAKELDRGFLALFPGSGAFLLKFRATLAPWELFASISALFLGALIFKHLPGKLHFDGAIWLACRNAFASFAGWKKLENQ
jgi:hypothetical protein